MAKDFFPSTHPLTPPLTEEVWLDWLRLLRSRRVGVATFFRLTGEYGSAAAALEALPGIARDAGVEVYAPCGVDAARAEWDAGHRAGARPLAYGGDGYPTDLMQISDPPPFLWTIGDPSVAVRPMVALVGARNASSLGTRMARKLAGTLGDAGYTVVSGLARGIDTAAHTAALKTGTIAVMAGGVDVIYPAENAVLGQEIGEVGLRLSERPMSLVPRAQDFPRRNRIVSGCVRAVIVVEAAARSGSLITARLAAEQGREVMAVPGHPFDARSSGCNMLLRDGATLVRGPDDVIAALDRPAPVVESAPAPTSRPPVLKPDTAALHATILDRLSAAPVPEDDLIRDLGVAVEAAAREISILELDGRLARDAGGLLSRPG